MRKHPDNDVMPEDAEDLPSDRARALHLLTTEMRGRPAPRVDYDRMEAELFAKLEQDKDSLEAQHLAQLVAGADERLAARPTWLGRALTWSAVAAAAAGAIYFVARETPKPGVATAPDATVQPTAPARTDDARPASRHVETARTSASFEKAHLARWTFEPGSQADVVEEAERVVVTLASGAIRVDVDPQPTKERFVVSAGGTRVAVHGTRFRVAHASAKVDVDVERGVVAVGAVGADPRWMVRAPSGGTFRDDGEGGSLRALVAFTDPQPQVTPVPSSDRAPGKPSPSGAAPSPMVDGPTLVARATSITQDCFQRGSHLPANVNLTVTTALSLRASDTGTVTLAFDPPLAPAVESCVRDTLAPIRVTAGKYDTTLALSGRR